MELFTDMFAGALSGLRDRAHWRRFLCNPLWLAAPVAGGIAFGVLFLIMRATPDAARSEAWLAASITTLAWIVGMWAATGSEAEKQPWMRDERPHPSRRPTTRQLLIYYGFISVGVVLFLGSLFFEGRDIARESGEMSDGMAFVVYWLLVAGAVTLPGWITRKLK